MANTSPERSPIASRPSSMQSSLKPAQAPAAFQSGLIVKVLKTGSFGRAAFCSA